MIRRTSLFPKSRGKGKEGVLLGGEQEERSLCGVHKVMGGWLGEGRTVLSSLHV